MERWGKMERFQFFGKISVIFVFLHNYGSQLLSPYYLGCHLQKKLDFHPFPSSRERQEVGQLFKKKFRQKSNFFIICKLAKIKLRVTIFPFLIINTIYKYVSRRIFAYIKQIWRKLNFYMMHRKWGKMERLLNLQKTAFTSQSNNG